MWIGKTKFEDPHAEEIVELMRKKLSNEFGVTIQGNVVSLRFFEPSKLCAKGACSHECDLCEGSVVQISMIISDIDDKTRRICNAKI
jgi:hypothetical protein